jgi:hypothetical protein
MTISNPTSNGFDFSGYPDYEKMNRELAEKKTTQPERDQYDVAASEMKDLPKPPTGDELREQERLFLQTQADLVRARAAEPQPPTVADRAKAAYEDALRNIKPESHEMTPKEIEEMTDLLLLRREQAANKKSALLAEGRAITKIHER